MGWYSLLQDKPGCGDCESDISKEKPRDVSEKNCDHDAIEFKGKSLTTPNCELFELVVLLQGLTETTFQPRIRFFFSPRNVCSF